MSDDFKKQGGASNSDPNPLIRWVTSRWFMSRLASAEYQHKLHRKAELKRRKSGSRPQVEYFHQLDDAYSYLALQALQSFSERYEVEIICYLVEAVSDPNNPEPDLLKHLARYDSCKIASHYGLVGPESGALPDAVLLQQAQSILAGMNSERFVQVGAEITAALWAGDAQSLNRLADQHGSSSMKVTEDAVRRGNARRKALGHYSGAMFYYAGEWYWGVDRLYHLEARLSDLGFDRQPRRKPIMARPPVEAGPLRDNGSLTLEVYPSLRSPYTAIVFDRAVQLAAESGVNLVVRPVLPMVMRGVPATRQKGMYIMMDCGREARAAGVPFGRIYDPIGDPVRRAYSLYPWACRQGKGNALLSAFMRLAFAEGINTNRTTGLQKVVEAAGLCWREAQPHLDSVDWKEVVEQNRRELYRAGLWGVPSFRLLDQQGRPVLALWGQDRLWLFAREIQRLLAEDVSG